MLRTDRALPKPDISCATDTIRKKACQARILGFDFGHDSPRFLTAEDRAALVDLAQAGLVEHRVARRANALVLLDDGLSCE